MRRTIVLFALVVLAGCSAVTPTQKTEASFVIYDVQSTALNRNQLLDGITQAVQRNQSQVRVTRDIQLGDLPEKLPRFTLQNPFANTKLAGLMAAQGQSFRTPVCENAILTLASGNSTGGDNTSFFLCVMPYQAGYSVNIYATFTSSSGGLSAEALGKAMAKSMLGDSSQYIPRTMQEVRTVAETLGANTVVVDSYIPDTFKGTFANQQASAAK
jgi:hypothetical protein